MILGAVFAALLVPAHAEPALAQSSESVRGAITAEDEEGERVPVEGVEIVVSTTDGAEVGTVVTDAEGTYSLELPGPGEYQATLVQESLPEDTQLRDPERDTLTFNIGPGQSRPLLFPLGESEERGSRFFTRALQLFVEGVKFGLIIAISAVGLSLIFGTTGLVNFAHGELVTFGAIAAWIVNVLLGIPLIPAAIIALIIGGIFGGLNDLLLWRPLRRRGAGLIAMLVISIGLSLFLRYLYLYQFGGRTRPYGQYAVQRAIDIGPILIAPKDLISIAIALAVLLGIGLLLQRTKIGKAMRAVADNKDLAESSGINAERVVLFVWVFGGALAALGGIMLGLAEQVSWLMGFQLLLLMFAGVILGGLGTAYGALVGSLVVGIFIQMSTLFISPELKNVGALLVLIVILIIRPQGILGQAERVG
ncbi:MAG: branched-chain amino acid ABC transporter permease [Nitriliruptorales bacterium]|nr:branched-chain amino acid ABC transporter permease [Nitriliruptorales bacterium]